MRMQTRITTQLFKDIGTGTYFYVKGHKRFKIDSFHAYNYSDQSIDDFDSCSEVTVYVRIYNGHPLQFS